MDERLYVKHTESRRKGESMADRDTTKTAKGNPYLPRATLVLTLRWCFTVRGGVPPRQICAPAQQPCDSQEKTRLCPSSPPANATYTISISLLVEHEECPHRTKEKGGRWSHRHRRRYFARAARRHTTLCRRRATLLAATAAKDLRATIVGGRRHRHRGVGAAENTSQCRRPKIRQDSRYVRYEVCALTVTYWRGAYRTAAQQSHAETVF